MAKSKSSFQCEQCGCRLSKWAGQCPDCQAWNSIVELASESRPGRRFSGYSGQLSNKVKDLRSIGSSSVERLPVGVGEIDRVLGGGIVPGSVILLGGDPGSASPRCCCSWWLRCPAVRPACTSPGKNHWSSWA
jgi:DNA repair protein RadA/Sms